VVHSRKHSLLIHAILVMLQFFHKKNISLKASAKLIFFRIKMNK